jgi:plastocyanin
MTWRLLTSFSLSAALALGAVVSGQVLVRDSRADAVVKRRDFSGIVVSLRSLTATPGVPAAHAVMNQRNKTFLPHVLPVMMGSVVDFPNFDPIFHNAFSSYNGQIFDVGLYPPGTSRAVRFSKPGVVRVFCNIHPTMSAVVLVLPTPYFTTTGRDGSYKLAVPPGSYELSVFHERATEQTLQALTQRVLVTEEGVTVSPISVSESGFLSVPHKNKYNKEYGPPSDDKIIYPGVRN